MDTLQLNASARIPLLGFGTWQLLGDDCVNSVAYALETGYRHIDTAERYNNHKDVAKGIQQSGIKRSDLFLTTKVFREDLFYDMVLKKCDQYLEELETDYIDLFLIHWPNKNIPLSDTLKAMDLLRTQGKIKAIGVSNFTIHHLEDALSTGVEVVNNQVELHPSFNQQSLKSFCDEKRIILTAYSPLGRGKDLQIPLIQDLAKKYAASASQVILNWIMHKNIVAIPKATKPERIRDNFAALTLQMDEADHHAIDNLPQEEKLLQPEFNEYNY